MLLIPDIHITGRVKTQLIDSLRTYTNTHPNEPVVFMGDYVYHFSYDRESLMLLYHFFVELFEQGRDVYVLAGNHDRIGSSFVFAEAQKAFDIINTHYQHQLHFITTPQRHTIEGRSVLFFPHVIDSKELECSTPTINDNLDTTTKLAYQEILLTAQELIKTGNEKEQLSGYTNLRLLSELINTKASNIPSSTNTHPLVIHHHYIAETKLPGQHSRFSYRDIALHPKFTQITGLQLLSGHLHQPFIYNNRCCIGSLRHTSRTEANQCKVLARIDAKQTLQLDRHRINPHFVLESEEQVTPDTLHNLIQQRINDTKATINHTDQRTIKRGPEKKPEPNTIALTIKRESIDYDNISTSLSTDLQSQLADIKLKKKTAAVNTMANQLIDGSQEGLDYSLRAWRSILQDYITKKYPNNHQEYMTMLEQTGVL